VFYLIVLSFVVILLGTFFHLQNLKYQRLTDRIEKLESVGMIAFDAPAENMMYQSAEANEAAEPLHNPPPKMVKLCFK